MSWLDIDLEKIISVTDFSHSNNTDMLLEQKKKRRKKVLSQSPWTNENEFSSRVWGGEEDGKYKWGKVSSYGIFLLDC